MKDASPYRTSAEAAAYLRKSMSAFYTFLSRRRKAGFPVTTYRLDGLLMFKEADLDAALFVERARHGRVGRPPLQRVK